MRLKNNNSEHWEVPRLETNSEVWMISLQTLPEWISHPGNIWAPPGKKEVPRAAAADFLINMATT